VHLAQTVKQALLETLHQEIVPELEQLVLQLPDQLLDFRQAETHSATRYGTVLGQPASV
jgi:hypothetical protein